MNNYYFGLYVIYYYKYYYLLLNVNINCQWYFMNNPRPNDKPKIFWQGTYKWHNMNYNK